MPKKRIEIRLPSRPANPEVWHGWRLRPDHKILVLDCGEVQVLASFDFWADDLVRCDALWHDILARIQVAEWVEDPAQGPLLA